MGRKDTKTNDSTHVRIGLSLAWKASLAIEDSFLCNRPYVTLDPSGVYINRRARSVERYSIIVRQARLVGFSHYDLVVDQLL